MRTFAKYLMNLPHVSEYLGKFICIGRKRIKNLSL